MKYLALLALMIMACGPTTQVANYLGVKTVHYTLSCKKLDCGGSAEVLLADWVSVGDYVGACEWYCASYEGKVQEVIISVYAVQCSDGNICLSPEITTAPCFSGGLAQ